MPRTAMISTLKIVGLVALTGLLFADTAYGRQDVRAATRRPDCPDINSTVSSTTGSSGQPDGPIVAVVDTGVTPIPQLGRSVMSPESRSAIAGSRLSDTSEHG